eukprot:TRINITY_DN6037_c1_g1_i4.p1 TRINITY_DN6037_c1_g1~~TRINITY_DN6037_c1_g1_i4.p1  ORF type:complete len:1420 (+),score=227.64 TRINITY_DN6037_c1_g1_i4:457-4260(+)
MESNRNIDVVHDPIRTTRMLIDGEIKESLSVDRIPTLLLQDTLLGRCWWEVRSLEALQTVLERIKETEQQNTEKLYELVVGNTSHGPYKRDEWPFHNPKHSINIAPIKELNDLNWVDNTLVIGASVPIEQLLQLLKSNDLPEGFSRVRMLLQGLSRVASRQIRSVGSVAGNIMMVQQWSFASDLCTLLMGVNATVVVINLEDPLDEKYVPLSEFVNQSLPFGHIIKKFEINNISQSEAEATAYYHKAAKRFQLSHALVNCALVYRSGSKGGQPSWSLVYGNIAKHTTHLPRTEQHLKGKPVASLADGQKLQEALKVLLDEVTDKLSEARNPPPPLPYPQELRPLDSEEIEYRSKQCVNFFYKFVVLLLSKSKDASTALSPLVVSAPQQLLLERKKKPSWGSQKARVNSAEVPISEPIIKQTALAQAAGQVRYTHDQAIPSNCLHGAYVLSSWAKGPFKLPDTSRIMNEYKSLGFVDLITSADVPQNYVTSGGRDIKVGKTIETAEVLPNDPIFADPLRGVTYFGQPIAMVVAKSETMARLIATKLRHSVKFVTESLPENPETITALKQGDFILTVESSKAKKKVFQGTQPRLTYISRGQISEDSAKWKEFEADEEHYVVAKGSIECGQQYHFYMETQSAFAMTEENGDYRVIASAQGAGPIQTAVAKALQVASNRVSVTIPSVGGGFGGKEPQAVFTACAAAVAARKLQQPVRLILERNVDMEAIGKRHSFIGEYKIAARKDTWKMEAFYIKYFSDGGCSYDATFPIMDLALLTSENAYYIPNSYATSEVLYTNKATSTAMRSFGVIQAALVTESAVEHLAYRLGVESYRVRRENFYKEDDETPYGQKLQYCNLAGVWDSLIEKWSDYHKRVEEVQKYNKENIWKKRGISVLPLKYGISFTAMSMNQGGALVNIYKDASITVSHGGVEMGQGLFTKCSQIVAYCLKVPMKYIRNVDTNSFIIPNASNTGASTGADLNGPAVRKACKQLKATLKAMILNRASDELKQLYKTHKAWYVPAHRDKDGNKVEMVDFWPKVVQAANSFGISLSAQAWYYKVDDGELKPVSDGHNGSPFYYFNYAAACSEVEIDVLTGEFNLIRSDIVYDAGHSLNPAIDIGQCEGGFVQGVGYLTTEELNFDPETGQLLNNNTWEYKIPCHRTIPHQFQVIIYPGTGEKPHDRIKSVHGEKQKIDPAGVQSSKSAGEPPLVLANTVYFAIRSAIQSARESLYGEEEWINPTAPFTTRRILEECCKPSTKSPESWLSRLKLNY